MRTLDLHEAAAFLKLHPQTLRRLAPQGSLPAAKPGRRWCFVEEDLVRYVRSFYAAGRQVPQGALAEETLWHCSNAATSGGSGSPTHGAERYADLLKLETAGKHRNTTTD
jgi:excisionase family DNA binding protein